jgi:hypothetical protein
MTHAEKPVYLIARGDAWLSNEDCGECPAHGAIAFGTRKDAEDHITWLARHEKVSADEFRVVEYTFSEATKA